MERQAHAARHLMFFSKTNAFQCFCCLTEHRAGELTNLLRGQEGVDQGEDLVSTEDRFQSCDVNTAPFPWQQHQRFSESQAALSPG